MLKQELRTRLTLLRPETGNNIRDLQTDQYEDAAFQARDLEPGSTVSVWNPRQDSRGKWLGGTIVQKLGPTNYLVNVGGSTSYVHVDQLRPRDERSMPQVAETEKHQFQWPWIKIHSEIKQQLKRTQQLNQVNQARRYQRQQQQSYHPEQKEDMRRDPTGDLLLDTDKTEEGGLWCIVCTN